MGLFSSCLAKSPIDPTRTAAAVPGVGVCVCVYIAIISRALAYCSVFLLLVRNLLKRRKQIIIKGVEGKREKDRIPFFIVVGS